MSVSGNGMWMVLDPGMLDDGHGGASIVAMAKDQHERRLRRRDASLVVEHRTYVRVGLPADLDVLPEDILERSEIGDTILISVAVDRPTFNEQTLRGAIIGVWGAHGAHIDVYDALLKKAGLA